MGYGTLTRESRFLFPPVRGLTVKVSVKGHFVQCFFYVWILCSCLLQPVGNLETLIYRKWCTENWCIMIRVMFFWCRSASPGHSKCHFPKDYDYNPLPEVKRGKDERWECGTWWCRRHVLTDCEIHIRWENKRGRPESKRKGEVIQFHPLIRVSVEITKMHLGAIVMV